MLGPRDAPAEPIPSGQSRYFGRPRRATASFLPRQLLGGELHLPETGLTPRQNKDQDRFEVLTKVTTR